MILENSSAQIISLVKEMAWRMRNPFEVKSAVISSINRNSELLLPYSDFRWEDLSICGGYPGVLLLFTELDCLYPDEKWDSIAHQYVLRIKESIELHGIQQISLYTGLAGGIFAVQHASRKGTRYQKMISTLKGHLIKSVNAHYLVPIKERLRNHQPLLISMYDLISGLPGIGVCCLQFLQDPPLLDLLMECLRCLVELTYPLEVQGNLVPGWYVPKEYLFLEKEKLAYPSGMFNLGLAHGIPGVLAFLAVAMIHGLEVPGQREAIKRITSWIQGRREENSKGYFWETGVSFEDELSGKKDRRSSKKDAWCYGTPGVSSSLLLAGKALEDVSLKEYALESFRGVFKRTPEDWAIAGPTLCHGIGGLLLITQQFASEMQAEDLKHQTNILTKYVLQFYRPDFLFGFRNIEPCIEGGHAEIDRADILEGAAGILLTLLSQNIPSSSWWHAPFLISAGKEREQ